MVSLGYNELKHLCEQWQRLFYVDRFLSVHKKYRKYIGINAPDWSLNDGLISPFYTEISDFVILDHGYINSVGACLWRKIYIHMEVLVDRRMGV